MRYLLTAAVLLIAPFPAIGQVKVVSNEPWACYFGGQKILLHYQLAAPAGFSGRVTWAIAVQDKIIARREAHVRAERNRPGPLEISLDLPETRPGIVIPLAVSVSVDGRHAYQQRLWVFPNDPFANQRKALDKLNITLFDPERKTARLFEKWKIPFKQTRNIDALGAINQGTFVIGEGVSFRDYRGLPEIMVKAAARGLPVLCLAPSGGSLPFPGTDRSDAARPTRLVLHRNDVIRQFDKRLDAQAWPPDGRVVASSIVLSGDRSGVTGEVVTGDRGWPWIEVDFAAKRGKLVICGFALVEKWDSAVTPRYLLAHLLKQAAGVSEVTEHDETNGSR